MKNALLFFLFLLLTWNKLIAQTLPFMPGNFSPLPGTVSQTTVLDGDARLSFDYPLSPHSTKGFSLNMLGTNRSDLDIDACVFGENNVTSSMQLNFSSQFMVSVNKSIGALAGTLSCFPIAVPDPENPVPVMLLQVTVYDELDLPHPFFLTQGNLGLLRLIKDSVAGPDTTSNALHLIGMVAKPDNSNTLMQFYFHQKVEFTIGGLTIRGYQLDIQIGVPYLTIPSMTLSVSNIEQPVSIYHYDSQTMPPTVNNPSPGLLYTGDELLLTGTNLDRIESATLGGLPVYFDVTSPGGMTVKLPLVPVAGQLIVKSDHGDFTSPVMLAVAIKPECNTIPVSDIAYFYFPTSTTLHAVYKWDYAGNPATTFDVRYRQLPAGSWTTTNVGTLKEFVLTSAVALTSYEFQVSALCPNMLISEWSEAKVLAIEYSDQISVSKDLDYAIDKWRMDTITPEPMDSFLRGFFEPGHLLDTREVDGFLTRFYDLAPPLFLPPGPGAQPRSCICKKVVVDFNLERETSGEYLPAPQAHIPNKKTMGMKVQGFKYYGPAQRNYSRCQDYQHWCIDRGDQHTHRRHTKSDDKITMATDNGGGQSSAARSYAQMTIAYVCTNVAKYGSFCGCEKVLHITAEIKVDVCAKAASDCQDLSGGNSGSRAEASLGGTILTGLITGDDSKDLASMRMLAAGQYNVRKYENETITLNPEFTKKAISLLYNAALAVFTAGKSEIISNLIDNGHMSSAKNDLQDLVGIKMYNEVNEEIGDNTCGYFSIHPAVPVTEIIIYPMQKRHVSMASNSYTVVRGWGCRYDAEAIANASYHLAIATDPIELNDAPACCLNATAAYVTRSITPGYVVEPGDIDHKNAIGGMLFGRGDRTAIPNSNYTYPAWKDLTGTISVPYDAYDQQVIPWNISPQHQSKGWLQGGTRCREQDLHDRMPRTGMGDYKIQEKTTLQLYPNAATDHTNIAFTLSGESNITLTIYDMTGKKVSMLISNEHKADGSYNLDVDVSTLARGQYIVLLSSDTKNAFTYLIKE